MCAHNCGPSPLLPLRCAEAVLVLGLHACLASTCCGTSAVGIPLVAPANMRCHHSFSDNSGGLAWHQLQFVDACGCKELRLKLWTSGQVNGGRLSQSHCQAAPPTAFMSVKRQPASNNEHHRSPKPMPSAPGHLVSCLSKGDVQLVRAHAPRCTSRSVSRRFRSPAATAVAASLRQRRSVQAEPRCVMRVRCAMKE